MRNEHLKDLERIGFESRKDGSLVYRDEEEKRDDISYKKQTMGNCPPVAPVGGGGIQPMRLTASNAIAAAFFVFDYLADPNNIEREG